MRLSLGLSLGSRPILVASFTITATVTPAGQLRPDDNAAADLASLATYLDTANYSASEGTITSVAYQVNNVTVATSTLLNDGDVPSFLVTASGGETQRFTIETVSYEQPVVTSQPFANHVDPFVGTAVTITPGASTTPGAVRSIDYIRRNGVDDSANFTGTTYDAGTNTGVVTYREAFTASGLVTYSNEVTFTLHGGSFVQSDNIITPTTNATSGIWPITASGAYTGTASLDLALLQSGPVALFDIELSDDGSPDVGDTLTGKPALWAITGTGSVVYTTNGTNAVNTADPAQPTILVDAADAGASLTLTGTMTDDNGSRPSVSNGITINAASSITLLDSPVRPSTVNSPTQTFTGVTLSTTGRKLIAVAGFRVGSNAQPVFTSMTVNGVAATKRAEVVSPDDIGVIAVYESDVQIASADVVVTVGAGNISTGRVGLHVVEIDTGGAITISDTVTDNTSADAHNLSLDIPVNGFGVGFSFKSGDTVQPSFTGLTGQGTPYTDIDSGEFISVAFDAVPAGETGRAVSSLANDASVSRHVTVLLGVS
ncbi:hypothetical protein [uncultured Roseobacter sp.]|uniref:hypothetical protein n=1 Tax=uncultured Roseobacter sp. TaxID=114847 RepID=UPI002614F42D|nr:hypothetical protein [uncultured Roseobacter sp.]